MVAFFCQGCGTSKSTPIAKKGVIDLRNWHFEKDGPVELSGEYAFFWRQNIIAEMKKDTAKSFPATQYVYVPDYWNNYQLDSGVEPAQGFASFRLTLLLNNSTNPVSFKFFAMGTAYSAYANGNLLIQAGQPGENASSTLPGYAPQLVTYHPDSNRVELVYFISNFHHARGGAWTKVLIGTEAQVRQKREKFTYIDLFLLGAILMMAVYHFGFYILNRQSYAPLFFAIFCFLIAFRILTTGETYLLYLFPDINWGWLLKVEYLSFYLATPVFATFLYILFKKDIPGWLLNTILATGAIFSLIVLVTPVAVFSHTLLTYQVFTILACIFGIYYLVQAVKVKRVGARTILSGFIILFITIVNDILYFNKFIQTGSLIAFGLLSFIVIQALLIAYRYAHQYQTIETQKQELATAHEKYRVEVEDHLAAEEEKRILEEKLNRAQRMEALGLLAGGVAHNLNNVLSGVVTYPEYMLSTLPGDSNLRAPLENVLKTGRQAADIVQDLITMSRNKPPQMGIRNLNQIIEKYIASSEVAKLVSTYENLSINFHQEKNLLNINGAEIQLQQALLHLISNAAEAQADSAIQIRTQNRYVDTPFSGYDDVKEGDYVVLSVTDNGPKIEPEDLKHIFEPFYTRKKLGRNVTGLGLAVVWGIVQDHQGYINLYSIESAGTTIELYFPATREGYSHDEATMIIDDYTGSGEFVLVVDDILEQREIASSILRRLGYSVITLGSGEEAVELVKQTKPTIILLDMVMDPGINGYETYKRILDIHSDARVLITSGYGETEQVARTLALGTGDYLQKPYTIDKLGIALKTVLTGKHQRNGN